MKNISKKLFTFVLTLAFAASLIIPVSAEAAVRSNYWYCSTCQTITPFDYCGLCAAAGHPYICRICRHAEGSSDWLCFDGV